MTGRDNTAHYLATALTVLSDARRSPPKPVHLVGSGRVVLWGARGHDILVIDDEGSGRRFQLGGFGSRKKDEQELRKLDVMCRLSGVKTPLRRYVPTNIRRSVYRGLTDEDFKDVRDEDVVVRDVVQ